MTEQFSHCLLGSKAKASSETSPCQINVGVQELCHPLAYSFPSCQSLAQPAIPSPSLDSTRPEAKALDFRCLITPASEHLTWLFLGRSKPSFSHC